MPPRGIPSPPPGLNLPINSFYKLFSYAIHSQRTIMPRYLTPFELPEPPFHALPFPSGISDQILLPRHEERLDANHQASPLSYFFSETITSLSLSALNSREELIRSIRHSPKVRDLPSSKTTVFVFEPPLPLPLKSPLGFSQGRLAGPSFLSPLPTLCILP